MNCPQIRNLISGLEGDNLSPRKKRRIQDHLQTCPPCRLYQDEYRAGFAAIKDGDDIDGMDFSEAEWNAAIRAAMNGRLEAKNPYRVRSFRPAVAYSLMFILVVFTALFGIRRFPWLMPTIENQPLVVANVSSYSDPFRPAETGQAPDPRTMADRAVRTVPESSLPTRLSSPPPPTGDVPSFTWISQETGLKIVWFINENLKLED